MRDENMSYTVKSSERLRKSGSEAETKALLYLISYNYISHVSTSRFKEKVSSLNLLLFMF